MKGKIAVAVLAGGKSSRMGRDKGMMLFNGKTMIEHVLTAASEIAEDIFIIANNEVYDNFSYPCFADEKIDCGPIGGIFTALLQAKVDKVLVLSCDVPMMSASVLKKLVGLSADEKVLAAAHKGEIQPLCAIYDKKCLTYFREAIGSGNFKMKKVLQDLDAKIIDFDSTDYKGAFLNINTPVDLANLQSLYDKK